MNNFSIRRNYGSPVWSSSTAARGRSASASLIPPAISLRRMKKKKAEDAPKARTGTNWKGKVFNLSLFRTAPRASLARLPSRRLLLVGVFLRTLFLRLSIFSHPATRLGCLYLSTRILRTLLLLRLKGSLASRERSCQSSMQLSATWRRCRDAIVRRIVRTVRGSRDSLRRAVFPAKRSRTGWVMGRNKVKQSKN